MQHLRRLWLRFVDMFAMEVSRPDGSTYFVSIDPTGFGECWPQPDVGERGTPAAQV